MHFQAPSLLYSQFMHINKGIEWWTLTTAKIWSAYHFVQSQKQGFDLINLKIVLICKAVEPHAVCPKIICMRQEANRTLSFLGEEKKASQHLASLPKGANHCYHSRTEFNFIDMAPYHNRRYFRSVFI